jgi:hypothetical protein
MGEMSLVGVIAVGGVTLCIGGEEGVAPKRVTLDTDVGRGDAGEVFIRDGLVRVLFGGEAMVKDEVELSVKFNGLPDVHIDKLVTGVDIGVEPEGDVEGVELSRSLNGLRNGELGGKEEDEGKEKVFHGMYKSGQLKQKLFIRR